MGRGSGRSLKTFSAFPKVRFSHGTWGTLILLIWLLLTGVSRRSLTQVRQAAETLTEKVCRERRFAARRSVSLNWLWSCVVGVLARDGTICHFTAKPLCVSFAFLVANN